MIGAFFPLIKIFDDWPLSFRWYFFPVTFADGFAMYKSVSSISSLTEKKYKETTKN